MAAVFLASVVASPQPLGPEERLQEGKALYREARFNEAILQLKEVATQLEPRQQARAQKAQLADAYLYLGLSLIAIGERDAAKENLRSLLRVNPEARLDPEMFAPKVIALLDEARAELPGSSTRTDTQAVEGELPKKGRSKVPLILVGAGGAAAAAAVALSGGKPAAAAGPTERVPTASVTAAHAGLQVNCSQTLTVTIAVTNPLSTPLIVASVSGTRTNFCSNATSNLPTHATAVTSVAPGSTVVVYSGSPAEPGFTAACCAGACSPMPCPIRSTHVVLTSAGSINAGTVDYLVAYSGGCPQCPSTAAAQTAGCASDALLAHRGRQSDRALWQGSVGQ